MGMNRFAKSVLAKILRHIFAFFWKRTQCVRMCELIDAFAHSNAPNVRTRRSVRNHLHTFVSCCAVGRRFCTENMAFNSEAEFDGEKNQSIRRKRKKKWKRVEDSRSAKIEDIVLSDTEDESEKVEVQVSKDLSQIEELYNQSEHVFIQYLNFMCCVILF